ncbi:GCN5-related N-acetyltransferase [Gemmatirosa kalamazoonensis]|uniref:GCN5-related N-acetyltransferase n=1 Tax=Gemmatirosa kalamazoonensis TaxID=861299 RepID=W0RFW3_9BACT|nr:GNAT family N-acetyltransferase [Gemmatirosa kalamazoonensis]AHG88278.1 GCN5-related N-acetyltransferase [Gemmatirosa kalamazoonensis]
MPDGSFLPPPSRVDTPRLVLRSWTADDAPALQRVVLDNIDHLGAWMPWATAEAHEHLDEVAARLAGFGEEFAAGREWMYVMTDRDAGFLVGGLGVHARGGPDTLELGYWIRRDLTGLGYVTEAVRAMVDAVFAACDVARIEIRCDPRNARSAAVARRAGFRHVATLTGDAEPTGEPRETMVWERRRNGARGP